MRLAGRIAVSAGLLGIIAWLLPWDVVLEAVGRLAAWQWLAVLAGFLAGHLAGVVKWRGFVMASGGVLRARDAIRCYAAGLFANLCLPSIVGGDVLRMALAGRAGGRPEPAVIGGLMDRVTDVLALGLLLAIGAVLAGGRSEAALIRAVSLGLLAGLVSAMLGVVVAGRVPLRRWPARLRRPVGRTLVGLRHLRRERRASVRGFLIALGMQAGFILLNAGLGSALRLQAPLAAWFLAWPLAKLVGLVPISLGGLAVREASFAALLAPFGVPLALGITVGLLWQSVLIAGGLVGGLTWWILGRRLPTVGVVTRAAGSHPSSLGGPRG